MALTKPGRGANGTAGAVIKCPANLSDCQHAQASADLAVKKVFAILGVNIDVPKDVEAFREDLRFGGTTKNLPAGDWQLFYGLSHF